MKVIAEVVLRREIEVDGEELRFALDDIDATLGEFAAFAASTRWDKRIIQRTVRHTEPAR